MSDIMQWSVIVLGLISGPIVLVCRAENRNFPVISLTENGDVTIANVVRTSAMICLTGVLSYAMFIFGHKIGWGGLETLLDPRFDILVLSLGLVGISLFLGSRFLDEQIYKEVARYNELLELSISEYKKEIRKKSLIKELNANKSKMLNETVERLESELDHEQKEVYVLSRELDILEKKLDSKQRTQKNVKAQRRQIQKQIETTEQQIEIWNQDIEIKTAEITTLSNELGELEKILEKTLEKLKPIIGDHEKLSKNKSKLEDSLKTKKELASKLATEIGTYSKQIRRMTRDIEIAEKNVNELEPKARDSKEKLAVLNNVMDAMQNRIKDFEKVMEDLEIAELTKEELDLLTLEYEKRLELHQANLEKDGKRIFER